MTKRDSQALHHLTNDVLIRAMDDELLSSECLTIESHLAECAECQQRYQGLRVVSDRVEALASSTVLQPSLAAREQLVRKLDGAQLKIAPSAQGKVLHRFGWGMALAATLALGIFYAPKRADTPATTSQVGSNRRSIETFEVNGETFVALPYSNADLPVSNSHVVEMQVPVSSLTEAGVAFEAISTQQTALDHSVLADVLVGMDGQPLGVHVLSE